MYLAVLTNGKVELILDIKNSWILTPLQNTLSSIASHSSLVYYWCFTIWDKVFKRGLSKFFKGCLPQNLLSPLLNTLSHMFLHCLFTSKGLPCSILVSNTVWKVSVFGVFLVRIFPYSVRMLENTDQNNSEYGHFSHSFSFTWNKVKHGSRSVSFTWNKVQVSCYLQSEKILFLFYKIDTRLQKTTSCIRLRADQILSGKI